MADTLKIGSYREKTGLLCVSNESAELRVVGGVPARLGGRKATETAKQVEDAMQ